MALGGKRDKDNNKDVDYDRIIDESLGFEDSIKKDVSVDDEVPEKPFDADKIRIEQQMLSAKYVFELYQMGILDTNPNFQRKPIWKENKRKSLLIESLMLRIPIPAFYFYEDEQGRFQVIDGQQRLLTIFDFMQGKFKLSGLEYIGAICNKKRFDELDERYKQRINRTQLAVNILDARSPHRVVYDIFRRINTGGIPLAPQEMRNAICKQEARDYLLKGIRNKYYLSATRKKINDSRMDSQEMFLRFVAFYQKYNYTTLKLKPHYYYSKLSDFLDDEITNIPNLTEEKRLEIYDAFEQSMKNCYSLFGDYAFVKVYISEDKKTIMKKKDLINKSLFTSFSVILANEKYNGINLKDYRKKVLYTLAKKLEDTDYENAISGATGDRRNIICNFEYSQEVINKCIAIQ